MFAININPSPLIEGQEVSISPPFKINVQDQKTNYCGWHHRSQRWGSPNSRGPVTTPYEGRCNQSSQRRQCPINLEAAKTQHQVPYQQTKERQFYKTRRSNSNRLVQKQVRDLELLIKFKKENFSTNNTQLLLSALKYR